MTHVKVLRKQTHLLTWKYRHSKLLNDAQFEVKLWHAQILLYVHAHTNMHLIIAVKAIILGTVSFEPTWAFSLGTCRKHGN